MSEKPVLVLASNSPRRRQLLSLGGWDFTVAVANVDESLYPGESPGEYVLRLAEAKARASMVKSPKVSIVIAADTAVVDGNDILGKPVDREAAVRMLTRLRGHAHQVYTGLAILRVSENRILADLCVTDVPMRNYSDEEIDAYVQTGDPLDKAGAYAIQHPEFHPVKSMTGCFASVMGLPLCHLIVLLKNFNIHPMTDVSLACQEKLRYDCPVSSAILSDEKLD